MGLWKLAAGVAIWRYGGMELWKLAAGVAAWSQRAVEARCRCSDMEVTKPWGKVASSGSALQACRRGGVEVWSSGALEARCRHRDVEVWSSGDKLQA
jgi:hypothetical protein